MSEIKTTLIEWNTAAGEKWMQVVVEGGTAAERKKQKEKTINDLKEFDERRWWHFWTWNWINPIFRMLKKLNWLPSIHSCCKRPLIHII